MKKLILFLLVFPFVFGSCSSDDDGGTNADIVGTWVLQSVTAKEVKTNNAKATQAINDDIISSLDDGTYTFTTNGKVTLSDGEDVLSGTYSLKGNKLTFTMSGVDISVNINLSNNTFSSDIDETEYYQDEVKYLVPNEKNVTVSKVITTYTYKRK